MGWIDQAGKSIDDFKSLQRLAKVLGELDAEGNLDQTSAQIDTLVDGYLVDNSGAEAQRLNQIFDKVAVFGTEDGQLSGFVDDWKLWRSRIQRDYRDYLKALLSPISSIESINDPDLLMTWPLLNTEVANGQSFDDVTLSLGAEFGAQLSIAVENEPGDLDQAEISYGFAGKLGASMDIGIPVKYGSIGIKGGWLGSCGCEFRKIHSADLQLSEGIKEDLQHFRSPFQLSSAADLVTNENGFSEVLLHRSGDWLLGGNITLGVDKGSDSLVAAEVGLSLELEKKWQRALNLALMPSTSGNLVLEIKDSKAETLEFNGSLGLDLAGRWQQPIIEKIDDHLVDVKEIVAHVEQFKDLGSYLKAKLIEAIENSPWESVKTLLKGILDSEAEVDDVVAELLILIEEDAARILDPWQSGLQNFGNNVIDQIGLRWPAIAAKADELKAGLDKALDHAFNRAKEDLHKRLEEIAHNDVKFQSWVKKLESIQIKISKIETDVNRKAKALFEGIIELLDRYQGVLQQLKQKLADATTIDLGLQWQRQWQETDGEVVLMSFEFDPANSNAGDLYKKGLLGNIKTLQVESDKNDSWNQKGIRCVGGLFTRYLNTHQEDGFKLSFLKFNLKEISILDIHTEIETDLAGNITVQTRFTQGDQSFFGDQEREIELFNAFALSQAKNTRDIRLSLNVSHAEDDLSSDDVDDMLGGLVKAGRVPSETVARAKSVLKNMGTKDAAIHIGLNMNRDQLMRLLRIESGTASVAARELTKQQKLQIRRVIAEECIEHGSVEDYSKRVNRFYNKGGLPGNLLQALLSISSKKVNGIIKKLDQDRSNLDSQIRNMTPELKKIARTHDAILNLTRGINTMRKIFLAPAELGREEFHRLQKEQAKYLDEWIEVDGVIVRFFSGGELRSRTIVLIESIYRLSGMDQSLRVVVKNSKTGELHIL